MQRIAVLGAGNGGCAAAADLTLRGYQVSLYSRSPSTLATILEKGGLEISGVAGEGVARIKAVTNNIREAIADADLIMLIVPGPGHEYYARLLAPLLEEGTVIFLNPGHTGGTPYFASALRREGNQKRVTVCESNSLTYGCRLVGPARVTVYLEAKHLLFAAFPGKHTLELKAKIGEIYPALTPAANVLETSLTYLNGVIHPPGMVLNAGWIEHTQGDFHYYYDGTTPSVARVIEAVDQERLEIVRTLGLKPVSFLEYFHRAGYTSDRALASGSVYQAFQDSEVNKPRKAPQTLDHRYMDEDVGFGIVPMSEIGRMVGVDTPVMRSLVRLASTMKQVDFMKDGLTLEKMGLEGIGLLDLDRFLQEGY